MNHRNNKKINVRMGGMGTPAQLGASNEAAQIRDAKMLNYVYRLEQENKYLRQGLQPGAGAKQLKHNLGQSNLPQKPGNVDDITRVIWPFFFPTSYTELVPGQSARTSFTVTQEASFIWLYATKTVHKLVAGVPTYIDPNNFDVTQGQANDLSFTIRDAQSTRDYNALPIPLDHVGDPLSPWALPSPVMFIPNSTIEVQFINASLTETYFPCMTFFGYRLRMQDREKLMSLVTG